MSLVTVTFDSDEWQVVPKQATGEMVLAGDHRKFRDAYDPEEESYCAMLAAAPQLPAVSAEPVAWVNPAMLEGTMNTQVITASLLRQSLQQVPLYLGPQPPVVSTEPAGITRFNPINAASNLRSDGTYLAPQPSADAKEAEIILELKRLWFSDADPTETRYADEFAAMQKGGA